MESTSSRKSSEVDLGASLKGLINTSFNRAVIRPKIYTKVAKNRAVALLHKSDNLYLLSRNSDLKQNKMQDM